jgi:conjugal transfer pilus assembly protein TraE
MNLTGRTQSIAELKKTNARQVLIIAGLSASLLLALIKLAFQTEIVIQRTPGMPADSVIEKTAMDKGAQKATLSSVTSAIAQINPSNAEYQKAFVQSYLSPEVYTRISREIDNKVALLIEQRELGSYYFVLTGYSYDPQLNKHFVLGDVHTVNAAKDTSEPYVFEYVVHVENYRLVVDDLQTYTGSQAHDSEWRKAKK